MLSAAAGEGAAACGEVPGVSGGTPNDHFDAYCLNIFGRRPHNYSLIGIIIFD